MHGQSTVHQIDKLFLIKTNDMKSIQIILLILTFSFISTSVICQIDGTDDDFINSSGDIITGQIFTGRVAIGAFGPTGAGTAGIKLYNNGDLSIIEDGMYMFKDLNALSAPGNNLFLGKGAGYSYTHLGTGTGTYNSYLGNYAGNSNVSGKQNTFIGYGAGQYSTVGNSNSYIGFQSGYGSTGANNVFNGYRTGFKNTTGSNNVFVGDNAGHYNTIGSSNVKIGSYSGYYTTTGSANSFLGRFSGYNTSTGSYNTFLGADAGKGNIDGDYNTLIGNEAGYGAVIGDNNVFVGNKAGRSANGRVNILIGSFSGENNKGDENIVVGVYAGVVNEGNENIMIGKYSGINHITGHSNTFIGTYSKSTNAIRNGATAIGYEAEVNCDDCLVLGKTASGGTRVGIGETSPVGRLHVVTDATNPIIFEGLTAPTGSYEMLVIENDKLYKAPITGGTGGSDMDWYGWSGTSHTGTAPTSISDDIYTGGDVFIGGHNGGDGRLVIISSSSDIAAHISNYNTAGSQYVFGSWTQSGGGSVNNYGSWIEIGGFGTPSGDNTYGVHSTAGNGINENIGGDFYALFGYGIGVRARGSASGWAGYFDGDVYATGLFQTSDRSIKKDIADLENASAILLELNPKRYNYRVDEYPDLSLSDRPQIGLIAQDVEEILPELVKDIKTFKKQIPVELKLAQTGNLRQSIM